ncbi:penicillin-binding protein 1C [Pendulispora brunnea]|uniref:peptidoglycan glycosyltransferase n=1 Tax=Pendulispora brunnea TaxID=2905690 RepID=A0ABZ2KMH9_9BACT
MNRKNIAWLLAIPMAPIWLLAIVVAFTRRPAELVNPAGSYSQSVRYVDREGGLLREVRADDASRARWIPLEEMGTYARMSVLAAEDRRFYLHAGVDPLAVVRAFGSDLWQRRIVSGASTLTMQLARLVRPHPRNLWGKVTEAAFALRIERALSKDRILEEYMNRAPFGPNLRGLDAASRYYFDKPPRALSLAEAATLAAIPRGPSLYAPTRDDGRVLRRRNRILDRMLTAGVITEEQHRRASDEPLVVRKAKGTFGAPHLVQALMSGRLPGGAPPKDGSPIVTTIDRDLQSEAETEALRAIGSLQKKHVTAASVLVLDNATGDVLAYVGSHGFGDAEHGGQNDGVLARRQPGSTLKPFVYGLGMEERDLTSASLLPDLEMRIELPDGVYAPKNYDERFHGPVRLREALANSYNVPAVWVGQQVGPGRLLDRLHALGFGSLDQASDYYGPALALGDGEVTLLELTNAYAAIARGGVMKPVRFVRTLPSASGARVMPAEMTAVLTDILRDKNARIASFGERSVLDLPFDVAVKTGTSKGFRDNWTVGFTREVTVGVWAGNFDGSAMSGISGITGAGPLFRSVMEAAMRGRPKGSLAPDPDESLALRTVEICPLSGGAPTQACPHAIRDYIPRDRTLDPCTMHESVAGRVVERYPAAFTAWAHAAGREGARGEGRLHLTYPHDGARFAIDPERPRGLQSITVRIEAPPGVQQAALRIDGQLVARIGSPFVVRWPLEQGTHTFVAEANGTSSSPVRVEVD